MGFETKIQWCDHTFNPWIGCAKVSAGCAHCYAEAQMDTHWQRVQWGPQGTRVRTSVANWKQPLKWNHQANLDGVRRRVFCASLADVFEDRPELVAWRKDLLNLIYKCRMLDWLVLTKRPEHAQRFMCGLSGAGYDNWMELYPHVWLGTSVEDQAAADLRIPQLFKCPAAIRFLSVEPLIGPVDLARSVPCGYYCDESVGHVDHGPNGDLGHIDWVIVGGESGSKARTCNVDWIRSIVEQCRVAGVPCFVKQLGSRPVVFDLGQGDEFCPDAPGFLPLGFRGKPLTHPKGGDPAEWPEDLRVREFPCVNVAAVRGRRSSLPAHPRRPRGTIDE